MLVQRLESFLGGVKPLDGRFASLITAPVQRERLSKLDRPSETRKNTAKQIYFDSPCWCLWCPERVSRNL